MESVVAMVRECVKVDMLQSNKESIGAARYIGHNGILMVTILPWL